MNPPHRQLTCAPTLATGDAATVVRAHGFPAWKRVLDLTCLLLALPGATVLGLVIACAIKRASPGPVLFRQRRIGYRGQPFTMLKFRTMWPDADPKPHEERMATLIGTDQPMRKADDDGDPRVYPLGAFLRHTGLDELPQLWNVLRGEMSLVGPRPCTEAEFQWYQEWQKERFATPPGLTGLWQVSGKNDTTFSQMIRLDRFYVKKRSLGLDLKILARTPRVLMQQTKKWWLNGRNGQSPQRHLPPHPASSPSNP